MTKKILLISGLIAALTLSGCFKNEEIENTPIELNNEQQALEINKRDQIRKDNLVTLTYALGQHYAETGEYPEAREDMCAKDLIQLMNKNNYLKSDLEDPNFDKVEDSECGPSGIYYFFRDDNPDYYTFGLKLEGDYLGNSNSTPKEILETPIEDLKNIRRSGLQPIESVTGNHFYIIGNYPSELMK